MSQPIPCPECKGEGKLEKQWGYCPDIVSEEEQIDVLRKCSSIEIDKYKILGRVGAYWTVECPLCKGSRAVFVTPAIVEEG